MSGGGGFEQPKDPSPASTPLERAEVSAAKRSVRKQAAKGGRASTRLAGRMMAERSNPYNLGTKRILG